MLKIEDIYRSRKKYDASKRRSLPKTYSNFLFLMGSLQKDPDDYPS